MSNGEKGREPLKFKASSDEVKEVEAKPPYTRRYFKTLFGPISDSAKAWVFIERFEPGAESYPHYHVPPQVEIFFGLEGTGVVELVSQDQKFFKKYTIGPGEMVYSPENWTHKIKNASDKKEWKVFCVVFSV